MNSKQFYLTNIWSGKFLKTYSSHMALNDPYDYFIPVYSLFVKHLEIWTAILLLITVFVLYRLLKTNGRLNIPGPIRWPIVGNAPSLGDEAHLWFHNMAKKYGDIFLMKIGSYDIVVLNSLDIIHEALVQQRKIFSGRPIWKSFSFVSQGMGVVFNSPITMGDRWRSLKSTLTRQTNRFLQQGEALQDLNKHVIREAMEMIRLMQEHNHKHSINIPSDKRDYNPTENIINVAAANVACMTVFGHRYNHENNEFKQLISMNRVFGEVIIPCQKVDTVNWMEMIPFFKTMMSTFERNCNTMSNWIKSRTNEFRQVYLETLNIRCIADNFFKAELEKLEEKKAVNGGNNEITPLLTDIFGAAQDTFTAAVQWFIVYLMKFPDAQREIQAEIDEAIGWQRLPNINERKLFPTLESFLHEVMRHTTFVPTTIPHLTVEDTVLRGHSIPKGTVIFVNQYSANHDARCWKSPEKFKSRRFLDDEGKLIHRPADKYMIFSAGARKCPGEQYVFTLGMHLMATLLSVCSFVEYPEAPVSLKLKYNLSMRPLPFRVKIKLRKALLYQKMLEHVENEIANDNVPGNNNNFQTTAFRSNGDHHRFGNGNFKTKLPPYERINPMTNGDISKQNIFSMRERHFTAKGVT